MRNRIYLPIVAVLAVSCFEKDESLKPFDGNATVISHQIEQYTSYFDFETNTIVDWHYSDLWNLGFGSGQNDCVILTNSGANWFLYNTRQNNMLAEINFPKQFAWNYDQQLFFPDSTAASGWIKLEGADTAYSGNVYLLGKFSGTSYSEIYRIKFLKVDFSNYTFCFSMNDSPESIDTVRVQKSSDRNFLYYSFESASVIDIEPDNHSYDLVFCPYYTIVTEMGVTAPYLVRGVLLNNFGTQGVIDSVNDYESINESLIPDYNFTSQRDVIGYDWKKVAVNTSSGTASYEINSEFAYIIRTSENYYYKMRFLGYELNGENGYPSFEFRKLASD